MVFISAAIHKRICSFFQMFYFSSQALHISSVMKRSSRWLLSAKCLVIVAVVALTHVEVVLMQ